MIGGVDSSADKLSARQVDVGVLELNKARPHFLSWALIACSHMHSCEQAVAECCKAVVLFLEDACMLLHNQG
jgi:hypothetical protein